MESFVSSCSVKRIEVDSYSEHFQSNKQRSVCSYLCEEYIGGHLCLYCSTLFKL